MNISTTRKICQSLKYMLNTEMKGFCINVPAVKKPQDKLSVGVTFSGIMFPSKGIRLEEGIKVFPAYADEDVLRNISR